MAGSGLQRRPMAQAASDPARPADRAEPSDGESHRLATVKLAFLFPGQGAQYPGMGQDLARDFPAARSVRGEIASALRGIDPQLDLEELLRAPEPGALLRTDLCQTAVFAHSAMAWAAFDQELRSAPGSPVVVAALGHSFGELTAHLAAGTLDLPAMSALVLLRGRLVLTAPEGALLNVDGPGRDEVCGLVAEHCAGRPASDRVYLAISQAPRLHAVGGLPGGVGGGAARRRRQRGAGRPLPVGRPSTLKGLPRRRTGPTPGCSTVCTRPFARTCASSKSWSRLRTSPAGTARAARASIASPTERPANPSSTART